MENEILYYTVIIPPARDVRKPTQWHAPNVCTRGAWQTVEEAHGWAKDRLEGGAYTVAAQPRELGSSLQLVERVPADVEV